MIVENNNDCDYVQLLCKASVECIQLTSSPSFTSCSVRCTSVSSSDPLRGGCSFERISGLSMDGAVGMEPISKDEPGLLEFPLADILLDNFGNIFPRSATEYTFHDSDQKTNTFQHSRWLGNLPGFFSTPFVLLPPRNTSVAVSRSISEAAFPLIL